MSNNKDKDNSVNPQKDSSIAYDHCSKALHALTRPVEQALKTPKDSQGEVKPVEPKK